MVFIMGCHRSGTSMLYHLLAYTGACDYISAYDIVKYDEIVRNRIEGLDASAKAEVEAALHAEKNRGVDNLPVGADYPEEYRFILAPKPPKWYLGMRKHLEQLSFTPHLTPSTLERFLEICRKKKFLSGSDKPLVLKNPNDFYLNFERVHRMLPGAKMILIHRHPLHVLNSYVKGFGGIIDSKNAYAALIDRNYRDLARSRIRQSIFRRVFRGKQLPRHLAAGLVRGYEYYLKNIRLLPKGSFLEIQYDELCCEPERHLRRIGRWLDMDITPSIPARFVAPRNLSISESVYSAYLEKSEEMCPYLTSQNYPLLPHSDDLRDPVKATARGCVTAASNTSES
jgi:hypothetical protein